MYACCHARTRHRSLVKRAVHFHDYVRQNIGHHMTRIELCSASLKALAALDPAGYGLDGASAQLEVALM